MKTTRTLPLMTDHRLLLTGHVSALAGGFNFVPVR